MHFSEFGCMIESSEQGETLTGSVGESLHRGLQRPGAHSHEVEPLPRTGRGIREGYSGRPVTVFFLPTTKLSG